MADILPGLKLPKPRPEIQEEIDAGKFYFAGLEYHKKLDQAKLEGRAEGQLQGQLQGRLEEARANLMRLATKKFGPPTSECNAIIQNASDLDKLQTLIDRVLDARSWDELFRQ